MSNEQDGYYKRMSRIMSGLLYEDELTTEELEDKAREVGIEITKEKHYDN